MENNVEGGAAIGIHEALDGGSAFRCGDILDERMGATNGADREEVDTDDKGADGGVADCDLNPPSRGGAEVEYGASGGEESILGIELEELEGGTRAVALLLGEVVELVLALLSLHLPHRRFESPESR